MPELRTYHGFISHAWKYGEQYDRLVSLLRGAPNFLFVNWSAPEDKPLIPPGVWVPNAAILEAIRSKMRMAQVVLVIAGMYANHSEWMQAEIDMAHVLKKPMVGIRPWGNECLPTQVLINTREDVGWNTTSIVDSIRRYALPNN
jgi:hypothetical protein